MYVKTTYAGAFMAVSIMLMPDMGEEIRERFTRKTGKERYTSDGTGNWRNSGEQRD